MARLLRFSTVLACFFIAINAFAAGGTCPSGTNYVNPSTGATGTLAAMGVNSCYYISASGLDTNSGATESAPFLHAPGMPNATGNAAALTPAAGMGFIFRGGDTWHFGASTTPAVGGSWAWTWSGSSGSPIYIGVDQTWYNGSSWERPILAGDNPLCNSSTCNAGTYPNVSSCAYQIGPSNNMVVFSGYNWIAFDNFEMSGICEGNSSAENVYVRYGYSQNLSLTNLYIHGWSHVAWGCNSGDTGLCTTIMAFKGGSGSHTIPGDYIWYAAVDGTDSDPSGAELGKSDFSNVAYSTFRYISQVVQGNPHVWHDNLMEHWYCPGDGQDHPNLLESVGDFSGTNAIYNNVFRHILTDSGSCPAGGEVGIWPEPSTSTTDYIFNNIMYDEQDTEYIDIGQNGSNQGTLIIFNNTWEATDQPYQCQSASNSAPFFSANNHFIYDGASVYSQSCPAKQMSGSPTTDLLMNHTTATAAGYTALQAYAYSPTSYGSLATSANSPTVGNGTNETTNFCNVLSSSSDPLIQAAGTACNSGTTYACSYNSSSHAQNCPSQIPQAISSSRPTSAKWDEGAYQTNSAAPNPPKSVSGTVQQTN